MTTQDAATRAQVIAARPDASTWLSANAGSGKTRVLTDRVARLLLEGVDPQRILCLTYTKAAASEMQNRLFRRLGAFAMLPEDRLRAALESLGVEGSLDAERLASARTLFARAIETPGGLKIQTIHAFCAALLRRFPLEAGVSPQFTEIEDRAADLLRAEIVDTMADGPDAELVAGLAQHYNGEDFAALTAAIVRKRGEFTQPATRDDLLLLFGESPALNASHIERGVFLGDERALLDRLLAALLAGSTNDVKAAAKLRDVSELDITALPQLESLFLTGASAAKEPFAPKSGKFPTKPTRVKITEDLSALDALMDRVSHARSQRLTLAAADKSTALHAFAIRFIAAYEHAKLLRGWLDFDDLITRARALLNESALAAWVLYRIDGGIDHILVDEAQDTSPAQWGVIERLAAEFTSGSGARDGAHRTLFVVGDKKQSIYSFQGADPREFDRMRDHFDTGLTEAGKPFQSRELAFSFRSSPAILSVVDGVFANNRPQGFHPSPEHIAFKSALPGRVDLWPVVSSQDDGDDSPWYTPLDRRSAHHHHVVLAEQIARQIRTMIDAGATVPVDADDGAPMARRCVTPGDFLILVQRRSPLFSEIIRACKSEKLSIAGSDRLKVGAELAVRDILALLSFLALPEDDLALATALKSPLFGWSEAQLYALAQGRGPKYLWQSLRERTDDEALAVLQDLRAQVDFLRPYDLIERILTRHHGRRNLLARLRAEAQDGIDALLTQALAYERNSVPSLTGFLVWMQADEMEIKRQIDSASDQIRVMTVHGAKGLEAPIVILPDCAKRVLQNRDEILTVEGTPVWKTAVQDMPGALRDAVDRRKQAEAEERQRLLYVALTRAEKWLIVAAAGDLTSDGSDWYTQVAEAMKDGGAQNATCHGLDIQRLASGDWDALPWHATATEKPVDAALPAWARQDAPPAPVTNPTRAPSELGGAKALPGDSGRDEAEAKAHGTAVHRALEHLAGCPTADRAAVFKALSQDPDMTANASREAEKILGTPQLEPLFGADTLAEVAITADLGGTPLRGSIDTLLVASDRVLAIDFKTNATVPATPADCPDGLLRQMGAYAHALAQIYTDRPVETAILWTATATLMPLPHNLVTRALQTALSLDADRPAT